MIKKISKYYTTTTKSRRIVANCIALGVFRYTSKIQQIAVEIPIIVD